ncbi:synaptogyrin-2-like [Watersipora subatra]|uniref:synaptogyrin-2-like n=1 Tax=Watersipora subatra TaxID=2589382 RepID=UPI00355AEE79
MEGGSGAYGAGKAGAPFEPVTFIKKPEVITRLLSLLFAIIIFGCISAKGYAPIADHRCFYNGDNNACGYGIGIGVLGFLICITFLVLDALFSQISNVKVRKYVVMADIAVSGLWCFLWFVGFIYLTSQWSKTPQSQVLSGRDNLQAALAFMFFSIPTWGISTGLAVRKYRQGVTEDFGAADSYNNPDNIAQSSNPYASFGGEVGQSSYQQSPFTGTPDPPPATDRPAY